MSIRESIYSFSMWAGYYSNLPAREMGKDLEKLSRPSQAGLPQGFFAQFKRGAQILTYASFSVLGTPLSVLFFSIASLTMNSRLEVIPPKQQTPSPLISRQLTIVSLNSCVQEGPFAPLTGGVVPPFDPVGNNPTRIAALAQAIASAKLGPAQTSPDIFVGQEFHDLLAQNVFVEEMKKYGYRYFILDRAPNPAMNNSGLLVAAKPEITDIFFIPFPLEDRQGLAKWTQQGAIAFSVLDDQKHTMLRIFNTHLNYGEGQQNQDMRNRQLRKHIVPLFRDPNTPSILIGDFNFDTSDSQAKRAAGLGDYINVFEGQITCTDEGKIVLRGKQGAPELEKIDALIANSSAVVVSQPKVQRLEVDGSLLSDHYSISATIQT